MTRTRAPISTQLKKQGSPAGCLVIFFAVFLVAGLTALWFVALRPMMQRSAAQQWIEVPCTVESAEVESHRGDDSTTYSIEVSYHYEYQGRAYTGNQYDFGDMASSGRGWRDDIVKELRHSRRTICYVNPENPAESVLSREAPPDAWWGLFPLIFVAVGGIGVFFSLRSVLRRRRAKRTTERAADMPAVTETSTRVRESRRLQTPAASPSPTAATAATATLESDWLPPHDPGPGRGPHQLNPTATPLGAAGCCLGVALFWNGIVSVFLWQMIESFRKGDPEWFLVLFLTPFVIVGAGMIAGFFYFALAIFNPRVTVTVSQNAAPLGQAIDVSWTFTGPVRRIHRLQVQLEGQERATYRQGTDTRTDKSTFARIDVADTTRASDIARGSASLDLPRDTMHSLEAPNNKIVWELRVHGHIHRWPDVDVSFPIVVLPAETPPETSGGGGGGRGV